MQRSRLILFILCAALGLLIPLAMATNGLASGQALNALPQAKPTDLPGVANETCLACHAGPNQTKTMPNGDVIDISISAQDFEASVHGRGGYACVQCHTEIREYPHPQYSAESARDLTLKFNESCRICHAALYNKVQFSVHAAARAAGNAEAATCSDCHGAHNVRRLTDAKTHELLPETRLWIPQTCSKCHNAIYQKYQQSVHGSALIDENNLDVPTCIDCHGVHNIQDPTTAAFRNKSPSMCAKCHTDKEKMSRYGLTTNVLNSYVSDFHGTTVELFQKESPDAETNKAVCFDCHGIHDIQRTKDTTSGLRLQENLLKRCQNCHPDATINFPTAWLSHYEPSPEKFPIVYYVNLFYQFLIPGVLGFMGFLVILDFGRRMYDRFAPKAKQPPAQPPSGHATAEEGNHG